MAVLTFTLLVLSLPRPVRAQVCKGMGGEEGVCCPKDYCSHLVSGGVTDCPYPDEQFCCESCFGQEGIKNPVIGILGFQKGELTIGYLLASFIRVAYIIASILVLVYLIWGAIEWLVSGGVPENIQKAQARMTNAIVGLVILALTYVILVVLGTVFGFDLLKLALPKPIQ